MLYRLILLLMIIFDTMPILLMIDDILAFSSCKVRIYGYNITASHSFDIGGAISDLGRHFVIIFSQCPRASKMLFISFHITLFSISIEELKFTLTTPISRNLKTCTPLYLAYLPLPYHHFTMLNADYYILYKNFVSAASRNGQRPATRQ